MDENKMMDALISKIVSVGEKMLTIVAACDREGNTLSMDLFHSQTNARKHAASLINSEECVSVELFRLLPKDGPANKGEWELVDEADEDSVDEGHFSHVNQRKRGGVRTTQINFRCSPDFRELVAGLATHLDLSIADVLEEAAHLLADAKGYEGNPKGEFWTRTARGNKTMIKYWRTKAGAKKTADALNSGVAS